MVATFPVPYHDELLYSIITRYQIRNGFDKVSQAIEDLLGSRHIQTTLYFHSRLSNLVERLPEGTPYNIDFFLKNHTMFLLFSAFQVDYYDKVNNSALMQRWANIIERRYSKVIRYCPVCQTANLRQFGEKYFSRHHNAPGVRVCLKHQVFLNDVPAFVYVNLEPKLYKIENHVEAVNWGNTNHHWLLTIAEEVKWLMSNEINFNQEILQKFYLKELKFRGFKDRAGRWTKLIDSIYSYFGEEVLKFIGMDDPDWFLERTILGNKCKADPLCHIILSIFLFGSIRALKNHYFSQAA